MSESVTDVSPLHVEQVFKVSGVPGATFVKPAAFQTLKVALRTPGRGVVLEGPSGIGKSTAVTKALEELDLAGDIRELSARNPGDIEHIRLLPTTASFGTVVIDDFHRLDDSLKAQLSDLLKVTSDTADPNRKVVIVGINDAGRALVNTSADVVDRIDIIKFETELEPKIDELVAQGEQALNISIEARQKIVEGAGGSFYVAQLLCLQACIEAGVDAACSEEVQVSTPYSTVQRVILNRQRLKFGETLRKFARGNRFRPGGRAPYLHVLKWLAQASSWSISILDEIRNHPTEKASVSQIIDGGYLAGLASDAEVAKIMHFDSQTKVLSVEDPMLVYYLRNIDWGAFVREIGFTKFEHAEAYDVALSFAGEDRGYAQNLRDVIEDSGYAVFYDFNEQHRILGEDVEAFLEPIYRSGSRLVVAVLGKTYGLKRWTLFEAGAYKDRIDAGQVVGIWARDVPASPFDSLRGRGQLSFDPAGDLAAQAREHGASIIKKVDEM